MPVIGLTADGKKIVQTIVTGPTSYTAGGFTVRIPELSKIHAANVSIKTNLKVSNLVHAVDYTYTGNTITFTVYRIDVTAAAPSAWSEVAAGSDLSALTLEVITIGL